MEALIDMTPGARNAYDRLLRVQWEMTELDARSRDDEDDWDEDDEPDQGDAPPLAAEPELDDCSQLLVAPIGSGLHVAYHGPGTNARDSPAFALLLETLADAAVAPHLRALTFAGPDRGANGTREWCFTSLVESGARFPALRRLVVQPNESADHNEVCIVREGEILRERGDVARLVGMAPDLEELVLPGPPDADFFALPLARLRWLRTGPAHDTRGFIGNLARSAPRPGLYALDFCDALGSFLQPEGDYPATPFEDYLALFESPAGESLRMLTLRNALLTEAQYRQLAAIRPRLQFKVTHHFPACYVSHWKPRGFAYRHLLVGG